MGIPEENQWGFLKEVSGESLDSLRKSMGIPQGINGFVPRQVLRSISPQEPVGEGGMGGFPWILKENPGSGSGFWGHNLDFCMRGIAFSAFSRSDLAGSWGG